MLKQTDLCALACKYGTDKCPQIKHSYTPCYYEMLKDKRDTTKKVMELGIGWFEGIKDLNYRTDEDLNRLFYKGASLLMWRDFFPKAQIYGIDIRRESMFEAERITTFCADAKKSYHLKAVLKKTGTDIDLFIDDGPHYPHMQAFVANLLMPLLQKDVIYIIEDVRSVRKVTSLLDESLTWELLKLDNIIKGDRLMVIKHK